MDDEYRAAMSPNLNPSLLMPAALITMITGIGIYIIISIDIDKPFDEIS